MLAFLHQLADVRALGRAVLLGLEVFGFSGRQAPARVHVEDGVHGGGVGEAGSESFFDSVGFGADQFNVKHNGLVFIRVVYQEAELLLCAVADANNSNQAGSLFCRFKNQEQNSICRAAVPVQ